MDHANPTDIFDRLVDELAKLAAEGSHSSIATALYRAEVTGDDNGATNPIANYLATRVPETAGRWGVGSRAAWVDDVRLHHNGQYADTPAEIADFLHMFWAGAYGFLRVRDFALAGAA